MSLKIIWSPRASEDYREIIEYIIRGFGLEPARKFDRHVEEVLRLIVRFPFMYPASEERKEVRRCVLSKQTMLYYRVESEVIELVTFWNNRRDPANLKL